jgi:hypothetical protein
MVVVFAFVCFWIGAIIQQYQIDKLEKRLIRLEVKDELK